MEIDRNRSVLVTGAGRGIGASLAQAFAQQVDRVILTDIDSKCADLAHTIGAEFVQADLACIDQVRRLGISVSEEFGPVDILINNAGLQFVCPIDEFPDEQWSTLLQVMLTAPFQLMKAFLPGMKQRGWGRVINIASVHGLVASPFKGAYIAAKHGLVGLTKTAALEVAEFNITVNAICPGYVNTALVQNQIADQSKTLGIPESDVLEQVILEPVALKRMVEPEEVAQLALYLAGPAARTITGSTQVLDGGWTAR